MIYSYKKCNPKNTMLGATVIENDTPIFVTTHKEGMTDADHNDLAEYICSALFMVGMGKDMDISTHDHNSDPEEIASLNALLQSA